MVEASFILGFVLEEVMPPDVSTVVDEEDTMLFVVSGELPVILDDVGMSLLDGSGVISEEEIRLVVDSGKILVSM